MGASGSSTGGVTSTVKGWEHTAAALPSTVRVSSTHLYCTPCVSARDRGICMMSGLGWPRRSKPSVGTRLATSVRALCTTSGASCVTHTLRGLARAGSVSCSAALAAVTAWTQEYVGMRTPAAARLVSRAHVTLT